jgi:hypothetical protein
VSFASSLSWRTKVRKIDSVHLVRRPLTRLLYQPRMIDDEFGAVGGMRIGRGNRSSRRKPTPMPLCPPQNPWARTRAAAVESRRQIACTSEGGSCVNKCAWHTQLQARGRPLEPHPAMSRAKSHVSRKLRQCFSTGGPRLGSGPSSYRKKEFTGPRSDKGWEPLLWDTECNDAFNACNVR